MNKLALLVSASLSALWSLTGCGGGVSTTTSTTGAGGSAQTSTADTGTGGNTTQTSTANTGTGGSTTQTSTAGTGGAGQGGAGQGGAGQGGAGGSTGLSPATVCAAACQFLGVCEGQPEPSCNAECESDLLDCTPMQLDQVNECSKGACENFGACVSTIACVSG